MFLNRAWKAFLKDSKSKTRREERMSLSDLATQLRPTWSKRLFSTLLLVGLVAWTTAWSDPAVAEEKKDSEKMSVSEEILDILKNKGEISDRKYDELKKRAEAEKEGPDWKAYWKDGLRVEKKDGNIKTRWGGRIMLDWGNISADQALEDALVEEGESEPLKGTGVEFRRLRFFTSGTLYETMGYKLQIDFAGAQVVIKDAFIDFLKIPYVATNVLRIGHNKEPISLEELGSSKYITFMERALPVEAFAPSRNTGILLWNNVLSNRLLWEAGYYYDVGDSGDTFADLSGSNTDFSARVAGTPWYRDKIHLLHLGLGYSHKFRDKDLTELRFRARPESHITDVRMANTGRFSADSADLVNPEAALVWGPLSVQGEYFWQKTDAPDYDDPTFDGWYAFASWFITGESRNYSQKGGTFGRVKPNRNFHIGRPGWGAFELAFRYSDLNLTDKSIAGGDEQNVTLGLNWYINPSFRIMVNYVKANLENRANINDDDLNIFQARFQVDF
jgi:phosphate-selective porin OprO/OprP